MGENILLNKYEIVPWHVVNLKIGREPGTFFTPCSPSQTLYLCYRTAVIVLVGDELWDRKRLLAKYGRRRSWKCEMKLGKAIGI
jgi:hypothetical protein